MYIPFYHIEKISQPWTHIHLKGPTGFSKVEDNLDISHGQKWYKIAHSIIALGFHLRADSNRLCGDSRQAVPSFAIVTFPAVTTAYNRPGIKVVARVESKPASQCAASRKG